MRNHYRPDTREDELDLTGFANWCYWLHHVCNVIGFVLQVVSKM